MTVDQYFGIGNLSSCFTVASGCVLESTAISDYQIVNALGWRQQSQDNASWAFMTPFAFQSFRKMDFE
jgi:hypothetical protein